MQAKPAKITELITKGAMEMVITVIQQVRSILRSARAHSPPACSLTNKISTGQSTTAVIWRQSDGVILEKEVIFRKKNQNKKKIWRKIVVGLHLLLLMLATVLFMH